VTLLRAACEIEHKNLEGWSGHGLIGLSAALFMLFSGRIVEASGILNGCFGSGMGDKSWRMLHSGVCSGAAHCQPDHHRHFHDFGDGSRCARSCACRRWFFAALICEVHFQFVSDRFQGWRNLNRGTRFIFG